MCKYCNKNKKNKKIMDLDNTTTNYAQIWFLDVPMLNVVLDGEDLDGYTTEDFFKINYCPMCGRKLKESVINEM